MPAWLPAGRPGTQLLGRRGLQNKQKKSKKVCQLLCFCCIMILTYRNTSFVFDLWANLLYNERFLYVICVLQNQKAVNWCLSLIPENKINHSNISCLSSLYVSISSVINLLIVSLIILSPLFPHPTN